MSKIVSGRFDWHELWTLDSAASTGFYTHIFPWTTQLFDKDSGYTLFMGKNGADAGCHKLAADSNGHAIKPRWNTYISAADVDATVPLATAQGATVVVPPTDIPHVGRFAMLADPQGAVFGLLCRTEPAAPAPMPRPPGANVWNELLTSDAEAGLKFYSQLFGWELMTRIDMGPKGAYLIFGANGQQMGGMMNAPISGGPLWLPYTEVENADALVAVAVKAGAKLCLGPESVPGGGRIANFLDPQGVMFAVHSMTAATQATAAAKPAPKPASASRLAPKKSSAPKRKAAKRSLGAKPAKKKRSKPAARKSKRSASKRKAAQTRRGKAAKRAVAKKSVKRAVRKVARGKSKRASARAKRR
jgi:predicted enzyme related to lactoylglutathione lyase